MNQHETEAIQTLQLIDASNGASIDAAYEKTVLRIERLTARGVLRHYRQELLQRARGAYLQLQPEHSSSPATSWGASNSNRPAAKPARSSSIVARQAAKWQKNVNPQVPIRLDIKKQWFGAISAKQENSSETTSPQIDLRRFSQAMHLQGRTLEYLRVRNNTPGNDTAAQVRASDRGTFAAATASAASGGSGILMERLEGQGDDVRAGRTAQEHALVEDQFCAAVLLRLEGDIIRYDARQELLLMAATMKIGKFRANFLMAQIVQAVRVNQCTAPSSLPVILARGEKSSRMTEANHDKKMGHKKFRFLRLPAWIAALTAAALLIDWLLIRYLSAK